MSCLHYHHQMLYIEDVSLEKIAQEFGTPCYVYSRQAIENNWRQFDAAFQAKAHRICYAVKANSNLAILNLLANLHSGFDIVSFGELMRVIAAHGDTQKTVFSGVGKTEFEIEQAIYHQIHCFDVESQPELIRLNAIAEKLNKKINIAFRINPDVNPNTHTHIATGLKENKFGIALDDVIPLAKLLVNFPKLNLIGIAAHIGSQITELKPFIKMIQQLAEIYTQLIKMNFSINEINVGGGLGITYHHESPPTLQNYADAIIHQFQNDPVQIILEPGRAIVGNAGILITRVEYLKQSPHKNFIVADAGMNDLLRPALYDAWQPILPVQLRDMPKVHYDITGPVCESADFLGKNRELAILPGDYLAIDCAGAYGFSMSSNYNSRCKPAEVLVDKTNIRLIRHREAVEDLFAHEMI
ncbi:MAG: hypothetical protein ACD_46C00328G0001 [uncultured bacterium]|nr:MAG: hypothetical protein ACD_46C00328G0001 [uncultured bacterium]